MRNFTTLCLVVLFLFHLQQLSAQCPTADAGPDHTICSGASVQIGPSQTNSNWIYSWSPATGLNSTNVPNPVASPSATTTYTLTVSTPPNSNLLVNGDFGQGNTGFSADLSYSYEPATGSSYQGAYTITGNPANMYGGFCSGGDHTGNSAMMVVDGGPTADAPCWQETVPVTPNTVYTFSGWYMAVSSYTAPQITVTINGVVVFGPQAAGNVCNWAQMTATWNSGSSTTATISIASHINDPVGNDFALDDLSFFTSCPTVQANTTVNVNPVPAIVSAWSQEGSASAVNMDNVPGQNNICVFWEDGLQLTFNANLSQVAWYIDGAQVTNGTVVSGLSGIVSITNGGQTMSIADGVNDFANHTFQVGPVGGGCGTLSSVVGVRRVASMFMPGSGFLYTNNMGTIPQRNTAYTFSLRNLSPSYQINYAGRYIWDVPGCTVTTNFLSSYIVTVTVPSGYVTSYDPVSGNHYVPGTVTFLLPRYGCLATTYSIHFIVPDPLPGRSVPGVQSGQAATLGDGSDGIGLGRSGVTASGGLELFPNPARDLLSIRPGVSMGRDGYVEVFTSAGVRVRMMRAAEVAGDGLLQVNVAGLADGLYFVAVHAGGKVIRGKFLVAR